MEKAFKKVLLLEREIQASLINMFRPPTKQVTVVQQQVPQGSQSTQDPVKPNTPVPVYLPIDVNGFYRVTSPEEVTYYVTTQQPRDSSNVFIPVSPGWSIQGVMGIKGQLLVSSNASYATGPGYTWSFKLQSDTDQNIQGVQNSIGATLYPPGQVTYRSRQVQVPIVGSYRVIDRTLIFYFTTPPTVRPQVGWTIAGIPLIPVSLKILSYSENLMGVTSATLETIDGSTLENEFDFVTVNSGAVLQEPLYSNVFTPGKFTTLSREDAGAYPDVQVQLNSNIKLGNYPPLRELGTDTAWSSEQESLFPESKYAESRGRGFSSGSILALEATGPHDKYTLTDDMTKSQWNTGFKRYSNFVMYQKTYPFPPPSPTYQDHVVQLELRPTEMGHLLSNMYLSVSLPTGVAYANNIGRSILKQVDLMVNETVLETLYDDWYIIRDQMFLDADEQIGISKILSGSGNKVTIPLEFFFCRRHSHNNGSRERLRKPYFPLCAMYNQRLYVKFTFQPCTWWTNTPSVDVVNPVLVTEEVLLEDAERVYYQNTPLQYIVNRVKKESVLTFNSQKISLQLTASFPVQMIAWFIRKKSFESVADGKFYNSRYSYGYTTQYINSAISLQFPSGVSNYTDVIDSAKITLNNIDILSTFQGSLYYSFKQPQDHRLSIPSKSIYMYSFGLTPKEYNQGGYLNFSKLNSQTTSLNLNFKQQYTNQLIQGYNLYLFYYGYSLLKFQGGYASLPYI